MAGRHTLLRALPFFGLILSGLLSAAPARAESPPESPPRPDRLDLGVGVGIAFADDDREAEESGGGAGLWLGGAYRRPLASWFMPSVYAETVATFADTRGCEGCRAEARALFVGAQARFIAPIPYFSPFFEIGLGVAAGRFRTFTPEINRKLAGVAFHIPLTLGAVFGKERPFTVGLRYLVVPRAEQVAGGAGLTLSLPIERPAKRRPLKPLRLRRKPAAS